LSSAVALHFQKLMTTCSILFSTLRHSASVTHESYLGCTA